MKIHGTNTSVNDLTRWNRARLSRFRYIDGGAAEWLEYLRVAHLLLFATNRDGTVTTDPEDWVEAFRTGQHEGSDVNAMLSALASRWAQDGPFDFVETGTSYTEALRAQYDRIPIDQTQQIGRAFARAFHILTETMDAYANEGFLATATQSPHLRRLLEMVDFQPRIASSAIVPVALVLADETGRIPLDRGLAAEWTPSDGGPILTYESLEGLVADEALNSLRPEGWDQRSDPISAASIEFEVLDSSILNIAAGGSFGVLYQDNSFEGLTIEATDKAGGKIIVDRGVASTTATYQAANLLADPAAIWTARPTGDMWLNFESEPSSYIGQVVQLSTNATYANTFTWSGAAEPLALANLSADSLTGISTTDAAFAGFEPVGFFTGYFLGNVATVQEVRGRDVRVNVTPPPGLRDVYPATRSAVVQNPPGHPAGADDVVVPGPYVVADGAEKIGQLASLSADRIHILEKRPAEFVAGEIVAVRLADGALAAGRADDVEDADAEAFSFSLSLPSGYQADDVVEVAALFRGQTGLAHEVRSDAPLIGAGAPQILRVLSDPQTDQIMVAGRRLIVVHDPETASADAQSLGQAVTISSTERVGDALHITVQEPLAGLAMLRRGHTVVYGNVVDFGHGKTIPEQVLGSGDASVPLQAMALPDGPLSTRPDMRFPGGVVSDIEVKLDTQVLRQVSDGADIDPLQPAYCVVVADDGSAEVQFLSRLRSGTDNVRMTRARLGAGAVGNSLPTFALTKPKPALPALAALVQPFVPHSGADLQDANALKTQGEGHFALMDRALSTSDFEKLAESLPLVWHAHAELRRGAAALGRPIVALTVVPSGGGDTVLVEADIKDYLLARSLPGTVIDVLAFRRAELRVRAEVNLKPGYAASAELADAIIESVWSRFSLEARPLGQTLFASEIVAVIEAQEPVENLVLTLTPTWPGPGGPREIRSAVGALQALAPDPRTTVHIGSKSDIEIDWSTGGLVP